MIEKLFDSKNITGNTQNKSFILFSHWHNLNNFTGIYGVVLCLKTSVNKNKLGWICTSKISIKKVLINASANTFSDCKEQEEFEPTVYLLVACAIATKSRVI